MPAARNPLQEEAPRDAESWHRRGVALADEGRYDQAISAFRRALRIDDGIAEAHNDLGTAYFAKAWHAEAEASFRRALELKPDHDVAWENLGATLRAQARLKESRRAFQRALGLRVRALLPRFLRWRVPHDPIALAKQRARAGDEAGAIAAAQKAVERAPASASAYAALSTAQRASRPDLAEQSARRAVELAPRLADAHDNLGLALWKLGRLDEAEQHAREAVRLSADGPGYQMNLALILKDAGRLDEVRALYHDIAREAPTHLDRCLNLGTLAIESEADIVAARNWYEKAQALGDDPRVTMSIALLDLLEGRFESAWPRYEARKLVPERRAFHAMFSRIPPWSGEPLANKRLLAYAEQGLGDEIMFGSMLPDLLTKCQTLNLLCDARLAPLFARSFPDIEVTPAPKDAFVSLRTNPDAVIALGSLGQFYRRRHADFPQHRGYLSAAREKVDRWRRRLETLGSGKKVGISWKGGTPGSGRVRRSLGLRQLHALLETRGIQWVSLQYGDVENEMKQLEGRMHFFPGVAEDMDEFAALVDALDLVVSVCNATVHVAGAIGKEVLVMAPFLPEWRYGLRGERMLWYPSARVVRQSAMGDWTSVLDAVKAKLQA